MAARERRTTSSTLNVVVNCVPAMDVDSEAYGVEGNVMTLAPATGGSDSNEFRLCNMGNCGASGVSGVVTGLPAGLSASVSVASALPWDECVLGTRAGDLDEPGARRGHVPWYGDRDGIGRSQ